MKAGAWLGVGAAVLAVVGVAITAGRNSDLLPERRAEDRPRLALLTSLPLLFGERFALDAPRAPALARLERRYRVEAIAVADAANLNGKQLLLMAHPRAQPATALVDLDRWVRGGGRVLLLADPKSDWPSRLGLGDTMRPQPAFADTGLLAHWGLRLDGPDADGARDLQGIYVKTRSPGLLVTTDPACSVQRDGFVAECRLGRGRAVVLADSDFLDAEEDALNFDALDRALESLESR